MSLFQIITGTWWGGGDQMDTNIKLLKTLYTIFENILIDIS